MRDHKELGTPETIGGDYELLGTATGNLRCIVRDGKGDQQRIHLQVLIVPGLGRNVFAPTAHLESGVKFILEAKTPHLQVGDVIIPVQQHPLDQGMCSLDVTFKAISPRPRSATSQWFPTSKRD